jgi:hypothetical protein
MTHLRLYYFLKTKPEQRAMPLSILSKNRQFDFNKLLIKQDLKQWKMCSFVSLPIVSISDHTGQYSRKYTTRNGNNILSTVILSLLSSSS